MGLCQGWLNLLGLLALTNGAAPVSERSIAR
jgi:hypothetical protein